MFCFLSLEININTVFFIFCCLECLFLYFKALGPVSQRKSWEII